MAERLNASLSEKCHLLWFAKVLLSGESRAGVGKDGDQTATTRLSFILKSEVRTPGKMAISAPVFWHRFKERLQFWCLGMHDAFPRILIIMKKKKIKIPSYMEKILGASMFFPLVFDGWRWNRKNQKGIKE